MPTLLTRDFHQVERAILALPGVSECSVSVTTGRARVTLSPNAVQAATAAAAASNNNKRPASSSLETGKGDGNANATGARDVVRAVEALGFGAAVMDMGGDAVSGVKRLQEVGCVGFVLLGVF